MRRALGRPPVGGVDQDGSFDGGQLAEQFADGHMQPGLGGRAAHIRWAICRASTQVKMWTRMLCSVQWCMGENDTTCGSLSWRKENSASPPNPVFAQRWRECLAQRGVGVALTRNRTHRVHAKATR